MQRFKRPNAATIVAFLALFVALGGVAFAATGQLVNIADGTNAARIAKVDSQGRLAIGDGGSTLTVDGTVTAQEAPPAQFFHVQRFTGGTTSCVAIGAPPAGKAWVVRSLGVNVYDGGSVSYAGPWYIALYTNSTCSISRLVDELSIRSAGRRPLDFAPGLAIPSAEGLYASVQLPSGSGANFYAKGYQVPSSAVPATAVATTPSAPAPDDVRAGTAAAR